MTSRGDRELAPFVMGWIGTGANYFEKYLLSMVLNLTAGLYVRNFVFFFYKQKTRWNSDLPNFFGEKPQFWPIFHCKSTVWAKSTIMTSLWRLIWDVCTFLVCMERGDPLSRKWIRRVWTKTFQVHPLLLPLLSVIILSYRKKWQQYVLCLRIFFLSSNTHFHSTFSIYGSIWLNFGLVPIRPGLSWIWFSLIKQKLKYPKS